MIKNISKKTITLVLAILLIVLGVVAFKHHIDSSKKPSETSRTKVINRNDLATIFTEAGTDGTMVIRTLSTDETTVINTNRSERSYLPSSTFKIPNSLIALEEKVIQSPDQILQGPHDPYLLDGKSFLPPKCEHDITFKEAFTNSCIPIYQEIARKIPRAAYERYLGELLYGNQDIDKSRIDTFWLEGDFAITPIQQIDFLEKLYKEEFSSLSQNTMTAVKTMMISEENEKYTLSSKTGWVFSTKPHVGWWVGWIENKDDNRTSFFALNMDLSKPEHAAARISVGKEILKELDVIN